MIEHQKSKYGWEFLFLGANIDAVETADRFGIDKSMAVTYHADSQGTALNFNAVGDAICTVRANAPLSSEWKQRIEEDFATRPSQR